MFTTLGSRIALAVFALVWTGIVAVVCRDLGEGVVAQWQAGGFPTTDGTVTGHEVTRGRVTRVHVTYDFTAHGETHSGKCYKFCGTGVGSDLNQACERFPVGSRVTVYYDPTDPGRCVLDNTLDGSDLLFPWFGVAGAVAAVWMWGVALFGAASPAPDPETPAGLRQTDTGWEVTLPGLSGCGCFLLGFGSLMFAGAFALVPLTLLFSVPGWLVVVGLSGVFLVSGLLAWGAGGKPKLVVDEVSRTLTLSTRPEVPVPFGAITDVAVLAEARPGAKGRDFTIYPVAVGYIEDGRPATLALPAYTEQANAEALARWLRRRLGLPEPAGPGSGVVRL